MRIRLAFCAFLLAGCALVLSSNRFWVWADGVGAVPLTRNLPDKTAEMQDVFDARVKARFPIGSSVADMLHELHKEGFAESNKVFPPDDEHSATRKDGGTGVCSFTATVAWRPDRRDRVKTVSGNYMAFCL